MSNIPKRDVYVLDVTGYGRVSTVKIEAGSEKEAVEKAAGRYGISVTVRDKHKTRKDNE